MFLMEDLLRNQPYVANTTPISALSLHKNSQIIAKAKPKIRIIHIFAPEIIKTDVANFRELVQRLTGKPTPENKQMKRNIKRRKEDPRLKRIIKGENEEIWGGGININHNNYNNNINNNSNGGLYLGGFADLDGFMQELNEYQMLPIDANSHLGSIAGTV